MSNDTTSLLKSIRGHTQLPTAQITFDDVTALELATEEMNSYLLPTLMQERQEFWTGPTATVRYDVVNGQQTYPIPTRAVGAKVRAARLLDVVGTPYNLANYELEDINRWQQDVGSPGGICMQGNQMRVFPTPRNLPGYTLEVQYYLRPAALAPLTAVGIVAIPPVVTATTTTIQFLYTGPDGDSIWGDTATVDVVSHLPIFDTTVLEVAPTTFDVITPGTLYEYVIPGAYSVQVGDYVCLPDTAPVVQAPLEWWPLLALKVAVRQLASVGDVQLANLKASELKEKEGKVGITIRPRREDAGRKVRNGTAKWRSGVAGSW